MMFLCWIVTLDVLKSSGDERSEWKNFCWIVTLDVLKYNCIIHGKRKIKSWIVTLVVLKYFYAACFFVAANVE